ncbi:MAG: hypothetical protein CTY37_01910 [Methylotenera sp.]|nr:MAG: hypothetical protein CTY37_01910 [Methylotenera sp.]PPD17194.1 MAG: hypothetical protein CTY27_04365 [Methylotenera sp.]
MNYITSCPACETQFLLNIDHLKAYRGKVRCGHCGHIFNAKNRLTKVTDEVRGVDNHGSAEHNISLEASYTISDTDDFDAESDPFEYNESARAVDEKPISEVLNVVLETVPNLSDLSSQNELSKSRESTRDFTNRPNMSNQAPVSIAEEDVDIDAVRAPIFIDDLTTDPKFSLDKPKLNIWLILVALLLVIVALLQSIYFLRSTIAVNYPQFKPYLQQSCAYLNCKVNLPQQLDLLTIDDSDMQESDDYQNVINFSSLLINNAPHAQAYPNIELTLTDIDDKPVLRKLVRPQEYLNSGVNIIDGLMGREEVRINLAINVQNLSVAGYRVLITY